MEVRLGFIEISLVLKGEAKLADCQRNEGMNLSVVFLQRSERFTKNWYGFVGPVFRDTRGLSGNALIHAARMLDAPVLKQSLRSTGADLAFMASEHVYDTVIRQTRGLVDPAAYRRVRFQVKEADITSWMYLSGGNDQRPAA